MKSTINLLPSESPEEKHAKARRKRNLIIVSFILFASFLAWFAPFVLLQNLLGQEKKLLTAITQEEEVVRKMATIEALYINVFRKAALADVIFQSQKDLVADINNLKGIIPSELTIQDVSIDIRKVKLILASSRMESITSYLTNLEDSEQVGEILKNTVLSSLTLDKNTGYQVKMEGVLLQ